MNIKSIKHRKIRVLLKLIYSDRYIYTCQSQYKRKRIDKKKINMVPL